MPDDLIKELRGLIKKYLSGNASDEEVITIENYFNSFADEPQITDQLTPAEIEALNSDLQERIASKIAQSGKPVTSFYNNRYWQVAAAALLLFVCALLYRAQYQPKTDNGQLARNDLSPGSNKAILTLANGSKLVLNKLKNGNLASQTGLSLIKQDSTLTYVGDDKQVSYNTITTPNGGQYQLVLADGTKVWLNAASSLKFPTAFPGKQRNVELTGEAYFEVAKNKNQPFIVKTPTQTVQVLGTHFNINAYSNESSVNTTLLEGSVRVSSARTSLLIKPGQESMMDNSGLVTIKDDVDTDKITAWKNGFFQFNDDDIQTIMRQVARWYNVDVEFNGRAPAYTYHGKISRYANASTVLKILELSGINFTIEGRKIIVK
jgi:ferric-dicitrate binding protein FerR (iron transport regulator)